MKYCTHCGNELGEGAVICPKCGCAVEGGMYSNNQAAPNGGSLSTLSIVGFVLAFICSIAGLICSIIAFNNAKDAGDERSKGFSKAGIIVSSCIMGLELLTVIFTVIFVLSVIAVAPAV